MKKESLYFFFNYLFLLLLSLPLQGPRGSEKFIFQDDLRDGSHAFEVSPCQMELVSCRDFSVCLLESHAKVKVATEEKIA